MKSWKMVFSVVEFSRLWNWNVLENSVNLFLGSPVYHKLQLSVHESVM